MKKTVRCPKCGILFKEKIKFPVILLFFGSIVSIVLAYSILILHYDVNIASYEFGENGILEDSLLNIAVGANQKDVRDLAINLTRNCTSDELCYFENIYIFLKDFDYVYPEMGKIYPAEETIRTKSGDCKNMVFLFCTMMRSVGQDCYWSINVKKGHIVATTDINEREIIVDLASDEIIYDKTLKEYWRDIN